MIWQVLKAWFRPDVRGLERIPATGPVLLVGNHSGGNVAPDTLVFTAAFIRRFGAQRPFFQLAHELVVAAPWLAPLRHGTVTASRENARAALAAGAAVLVYPGGDWEAHRPVWQGHRVDFHDRHGFIRLALESGAARPGRLDRRPGDRAGCRPGRVPGALRDCTAGCGSTCCRSRSHPWGLDVGVLGHLPLPAKLTEVLEPIDVGATSVPTSTPPMKRSSRSCKARWIASPISDRWPVLG